MPSLQLRNNATEVKACKINVVPQSQWWLLLMVAFTSGFVGLDPDCQIHAVCVTCTLKSSVRLTAGSLC